MTTAVPFLMFQGECEAALTFYIGLIPGSCVVSLERYDDGGAVRMAHVVIADMEIRANDSTIRHGFSFTPSSSIFLDCTDNDEFERIVAAMAEGGQFLMPVADYGFSRRFAWLNDRFGVSWQINLP